MADGVVQLAGDAQPLGQPAAVGEEVARRPQLGVRPPLAESVRACLADDSTVIDLKGPHRIPLLRHAQAGKQDAVVELLVRHGAKA